MDETLPMDPILEGEAKDRRELSQFIILSGDFELREKLERKLKEYEERMTGTYELSKFNQDTRYKQIILGRLLLGRVDREKAEIEAGRGKEKLGKGEEPFDISVFEDAWRTIEGYIENPENIRIQEFRKTV